MTPYQLIFMILLTPLFSLTTSCATRSSLGKLEILTVKKNEAPGAVSFIPHIDSRPMKSYVAMNLPLSEYETIRKALEEKLKEPLQSRGEAHITLITPVEFEKVLSQYLTIHEMNQLSLSLGLQESAFQKICVGKGSAQLQGQWESTYFVVIESNSLLQIRKAIQKLYIERGGNPQAFQAEEFYPHITLGFTQRDLHVEDGVIKDFHRCVFTLQEEK